jgi:antirestriction protein ArdC
MTWPLKSATASTTQTELESTPWYEFGSYLDCCRALGIAPSVGRWAAYTRYYRSVLESEQS